MVELGFVFGPDHLLGRLAGVGLGTLDDGLDALGVLVEEVPKVRGRAVLVCHSLVPPFLKPTPRSSPRAAGPACPRCDSALPASPRPAPGALRSPPTSPPRGRPCRPGPR